MQNQAYLIYTDGGGIQSSRRHKKTFQLGVGFGEETSEVKSCHIPREDSQSGEIPIIQVISNKVYVWTLVLVCK